MRTFAFIMIFAMISFAAYGSIAIIGRRSSPEERRFTARNRAMFIQSFPLLFYFTILTFSIVLLYFFVGMLKYTNPEAIAKMMDHEFAIKDILIPFILMVAVSLPPSLKNYKDASIELKNNFPLLILPVLLLVFSNSLTISLIISLLLKR